MPETSSVLKGSCRRNRPQDPDDCQVRLKGRVSCFSHDQIRHFMLVKAVLTAILSEGIKRKLSEREEAMTTEEKLIKNKLGLLELAK